jgi:hypothetical protein
MTDIANRRRHRRVPASIRVFTRGVTFSNAVLDISQGGAQIETPIPLPPGTLSVFSMKLPHHDAPLSITGRVVWSRPGVMGIAFTKREPMIASYVERLERAAVQL